MTVSEIQKVLAAITIIGMLAGGGVGYGVMQERLSNTRSEITALRSEVETLKAEAVRKKEFEDIVKEFKETTKTLSEDIKKLLQRMPGKN